MTRTSSCIDGSGSGLQSHKQVFVEYVEFNVDKVCNLGHLPLLPFADP